MLNIIISTEHWPVMYKRVAKKAEIKWNIAQHSNCTILTLKSHKMETKKIDPFVQQILNTGCSCLQRTAPICNGAIWKKVSKWLIVTCLQCVCIIIAYIHVNSKWFHPDLWTSLFGLTRRIMWIHKFNFTYNRPKMARNKIAYYKLHQQHEILFCSKWAL